MSRAILLTSGADMIFRYATDASKLETELEWKANETFDTEIIKTVEEYLK